MFIDTHCHLNDERFKDDIEGYIKRAQNEGVNQLLVIGWDVISSQVAIHLAETFPNVYAVVGVHPVDAVKTNLDDLIEIEKMLSHPKVVALGEIGLDYYWIKDAAEREREHTFFIEQINIANKHQKPIVIHMRDATEDTYQVLLNHKPIMGGVLHSFSSSSEMALKFVKLGMHIGLGGPVTYLNAKEPKEVAKVVPSDRLLLETDAPYLSPHPFRGKTNESARVPLIGQVIADLRGVSLDVLADQTTSNAKRLFKL